jgi:hypothetical protein
VTYIAEFREELERAVWPRCESGRSRPTARDVVVTPFVRRIALRASSNLDLSMASLPQSTPTATGEIGRIARMGSVGLSHSARSSVSTRGTRSDRRYSSEPLVPRREDPSVNEYIVVDTKEYADDAPRRQRSDAESTPPSTRNQEETMIPQQRTMTRPSAPRSDAWSRCSQLDRQFVVAWRGR